MSIQCDRSLGGISWPLQIPPEITSSPWFAVLTDRAKEVSRKNVPIFSHSLRLSFCESMNGKDCALPRSIFYLCNERVTYLFLDQLTNHQGRY